MNVFLFQQLSTISSISYVFFCILQDSNTLHTYSQLIENTSFSGFNF